MLQLNAGGLPERTDVVQRPFLGAPALLHGTAQEIGEAAPIAGRREGR